MELGMRLAAWRAWRRCAACGLVGDVGNAWCSKCRLCWRGLAVEMLRAWVRGNVAVPLAIWRAGRLWLRSGGRNDARVVCGLVNGLSTSRSNLALRLVGSFLPGNATRGPHCRHVVRTKWGIRR